MFENILGHEKQIDFLKSSIEMNTISHCYLFSGISGIGKTTIAKEFAKGILKTNNLDTCIDYKYIYRKEDKKNIIIEQIREDIIEDIYIKPILGDRKVYIIDGFDELNIGAQNALLKTLEEPPKYIVMILVTSKVSSILPTILSRVTKVNFSSLSNETIKEYVNKILHLAAPDDIIDFCNGSIGELLDIIKNDQISNLKNIKELYNLLVSKDTIESFKMCEIIDFNDKYMLDYLEYIFLNNDKTLCVQIIEKVKERLQYNANYDIVIDNMILKCIDSM